MGERDFAELTDALRSLLQPRESKITIGGATVLTLMAGLIAFLVLGYFNNAGDIGKLKLQDEYFRATIVEVKTTMQHNNDLLTAIRDDQIRRQGAGGK